MKKSLIVLILVLTTAVYFWNAVPSQFTANPKWSLSFSHTFARDLDLDWKKVYTEILSDLHPNHIRLPVYWSVVESKEGEYYFSDYDFMIEKAKESGVGVVLVVGRRVPRWPECHIPDWAQNISYDEQNKRIKNYIIEVVGRYKDEEILYAWQVENEPFLPLFGECPSPDKDALDEEIRLVSFMDSKHPIIVTDSGELSVWLPAYKRGDVFGTTMYRTVWSNYVSPYLGYITYPLSPKFFWFKANIARALFGEKQIIVSELQAEPWAPNILKSLSTEEQEKTFNLEKFHENIEYARAVGFSEVYLWGVEWWYFMKEVNGRPEFWEVGKDLFSKQER